MKTRRLAFQINAFLFMLLAPLAAVAQDFSKVDIHGFISQGFIYSSDNNFLDNQSSDGSFEFNEVGINFSSDINDELWAGVQLLSRDLGDLYNNEIQVDWAVANYQFSEELGLKAGIMRRPLGLFNDIRDIDGLRSTILLPQSVYNENQRDGLIRVQGVGLHGTLDADNFGEFAYQLMFGTTNLDAEDTGESRRIENVIPIDIEDFDFNKVYVGSLQWNTPIQGLLVGGTAGFTEFEATGTGEEALGPFAGAPVLFDFNKFDIYTGSVQYSYEFVTLIAEYFRRSISADLTSGDNVLPSLDGLTSEGYYVMGVFGLSETFELSAYWSQFIFDTDDRDSKTDDVALSLRANLDENWTAKVEGHYIDGTSLLNASENPDGFEEDFFLFLSKLSYTF